MFFSLMTPKSNLKAYHYKDLHVFHPDETNLNKSLDHFFELYGMRNWTNREFWLLDITPFHLAGQSLESVLKEMPNLDLDDDFFVFANNGTDAIDIWEYYEINPSIPRQLLEYGKWDAEQGMKLLGKPKWIRRRDLKVI